MSKSGMEWTQKQPLLLSFFILSFMVSPNQVLARANARQHQQLGRLDSPAGQDDVPVGMHLCQSEDKCDRCGEYEETKNWTFVRPQLVKKKYQRIDTGPDKLACTPRR